MNKTPLILYLALAGLLMAMLLGKQGASLLGGEETKPFPNLAITSFDGSRKWSPLLIQHRVTLVNFFATWCAPCTQEVPELIALRKAFPNVQIIGIVWNDKPENVNQWLKANGNPFYSIWQDKDGAATIELGIRGIPETFVLDGAGNIRYRIPAMITPALRKEKLDPLLKQLSDEVSHGR